MNNRRYTMSSQDASNNRTAYDHWLQDGRHDCCLALLQAEQLNSHFYCVPCAQLCQPTAVNFLYAVHANRQQVQLGDQQHRPNPTPTSCLVLLTSVPLQRIKQLRQHANPDVQRLATRLIHKLRQDLAETTVRRRRKITGYTVPARTAAVPGNEAAEVVAAANATRRATAAAPGAVHAHADDD